MQCQNDANYRCRLLILKIKLTVFSEFSDLRLSIWFEKVSRRKQKASVFFVSFLCFVPFTMFHKVLLIIFVG